jgi:hypothetical protein
MDWSVYQLRKVAGEEGADHNSLEFVASNVFAKYVTCLGIVHEKLALYEHHQNGVIERTNWMVTEMCRALIHTWGLPPTLWSYAVRHVVYIFNWMVHAGKHTTPLEIALGVRLLLAMLRVFGCVAYAYQHNHLKQVIPYAGRYYHVGILQDANAWLLWCEETGNVITAASVRFNESPVLPSVYCMDVGVREDDPQTKAIVSAIETGMLGDALDAQDALVDMLERRDPYGADSPTYQEAVKSLQVKEWQAAMAEEQGSLEELGVHVKANPPANKKKLLRTCWLLGTKRDMLGNILRRKAWIIVGVSALCMKHTIYEYK